MNVTPPSVYTGALPFGIEIRKVEPGTVITHPVTGETAMVDDGNAVACGRIMYLTPTMFEALKDHPQVKDMSA